MGDGRSVGVKATGKWSKRKTRSGAQFRASNCSEGGECDHLSSILGVIGGSGAVHDVACTYVAALWGVVVALGDGGRIGVVSGAEHSAQPGTWRHRACNTSVMWLVNAGGAVGGAESHMSINVASVESSKAVRRE
jgi:hypothetical protein